MFLKMSTKWRDKVLADQQCAIDTLAYSRATLETLAGHFDATCKIILSGCEGNVTNLGDEERDEFAEAVMFNQHARAAIARIDVTISAITSTTN